MAKGGHKFGGLRVLIEGGGLDDKWDQASWDSGNCCEFGVGVSHSGCVEGVGLFVQMFPKRWHSIVKI